MQFSKKFVCEDLEYNRLDKPIAAPLFRKSFTVENVKTAEITIGAAGFYDLFVNGTKITKGYLAPYISNPDHYIYFDNYDLVPYLKEGENVIGVMLGDGFQNGKTETWDFRNNIFNSAPLLALCVEVNDEILLEADDMECTKGPVLFSDYRMGVFYDARKEQTGWNMPGFDAAGWHKSLLHPSPRGKARLCEADPIVKSKELQAVSIQKGGAATYEPDMSAEYFNSILPFEQAVPKTGGYIYDFGENNAGVLRLKIKGTPGQKIDLQCAEILTDGQVNYRNINYYFDGFSQRDIYYVKGEAEEIFETPFVFHGFRYVYVHGITKEQATKDLLTFVVLSSDLEERGTFSCSDEMANTLYQMGRRSDISNFYYFPMDCPQREKNGWTGDASMSAEHMILTIGAEKSWQEWLYNIRAAQKENGQIPGIVPTDTWGYAWGSGPAWDSVLFNLPYLVWQYRGDTEIIKENAAAMLRYLEYIAGKRDEKGIVNIGLGDWVPVNRNSGDYEAPLGFTNGVMLVDMCRKASEMFKEIHLPMHKAFADQLGKEMLAAVRTVYIDFETLNIQTECQTVQAMAIFYDIFTPEEKSKAFLVLMDHLKRDNYNFTCGFLGMRVLFHVLSQFGEADLAYHMITKTDFPSYGYWVSKGETTFLETFHEYDGYYHSSKNHHFLGDILNFFMSRVGGLQVVDANTVFINPSFVQKLNWCKTSHTLKNGTVTVEWSRKGDAVEVIVQAPEGVQITVSDNLQKIDGIHYLTKA